MILNLNQIQVVETEMLREVVSILSKYKILFYMGFGSALGAVRHKGNIPWDSDVDIIVPAQYIANVVELLRIHLNLGYKIESFEEKNSYGFLIPRVSLKNSSNAAIHIDIFPLVGVPKDIGERERVCREYTTISRVMYKKYLLKRLYNRTYPKMFICKILELKCLFVSRKQIHDRFNLLMKKYPFETSDDVTIAGIREAKENILSRDIYGEPIWMRYNGFDVPVPHNWHEYLIALYGDYSTFPSEGERRKLMMFQAKISRKDESFVKCLLNKNHTSGS